jgi:hypothetical protein
MDWSEQLLWVGTASAAGLLIGIERGWKLRMAPDGARVAGIRTFTLLGLLAGVAGFIATRGYGFVAGALIAAASATLAIGYSRGLRMGEKADATARASRSIRRATRSCRRRAGRPWPKAVAAAGPALNS